MSFKSQFADLLHHMRDVQLTFHERLTEEERTRVGTETDWSAKDNLFHNMFWAKFHLNNLKTFDRDGVWPEREDGGNFDKTNAEIFARYRHKPWDETHAMIRDAYARADAYLERSDDEALSLVIEDEGRQRPKWRLIAGNHVTHPMIHMWEYLLKNGHREMLAELFGEPFFDRLLALSDDNEWRGTTLYNLACVYALSGKKDVAIARLGEALRLSPNLTEWSKEDADLASLRDDPAYQALYA